MPRRAKILVAEDIKFMTIYCQEHDTIVTLTHGVTCSNINQGIVYLTKNGNFCKGTRVSKIIARAKVDARAVLLKIVHWFLSYVCNRKFAAFGCFAPG